MFEPRYGLELLSPRNCDGCGSLRFFLGELLQALLLREKKSRSYLSIQQYLIVLPKTSRSTKLDGPLPLIINLLVIDMHCKGHPSIVVYSFLYAALSLLRIHVYAVLWFCLGFIIASLVSDGVYVNGAHRNLFGRE